MMKRLSPLLVMALFFSSLGNAQDITGDWHGALKFGGMQLRLVFHVEETENGYLTTMDSPDQGAKDIPVTETTLNDKQVTFKIAPLSASFEGAYNNETIEGTFTQSGQNLPLSLSREASEAVKPKRPQEPKEPFPYHSEDITFVNEKADVTLAGTLTLPQKEGKFPAVILISGSGPQNRNEELLGHKPFLVISDYFTRNGIAVLRYDDRGTAGSTGDFKAATSADFASDVEAAVEYLLDRKEIHQGKIGLVGHSEGGLIAPMVASESDDIDFIVLLAGPGISGYDILLQQQKLIAKASGASDEDINKMSETNQKAFDMVRASEDINQLKTDLRNSINQAIQDSVVTIPQGMTKENFIDSQLKAVATPWFQYFLKYDPAPTLQKVECPVLAVNGELDLQVPSQENLKAIEAAVKKGGNENVTVVEYPNLNHLFQESTTGSPAEYAEIEMTFSPLVLQEITDWIKQQTK